MQELGKWRFAALFAAGAWVVLGSIGALMVLAAPWGLVIIIGFSVSAVLYAIGVAVYSDITE